VNRPHSAMTGDEAYARRLALSQGLSQENPPKPSQNPENSTSQHVVEPAASMLILSPPSDTEPLLPPPPLPASAMAPVNVPPPRDSDPNVVAQLRAQEGKATATAIAARLAALAPPQQPEPSEQGEKESQLETEERYNAS
jgi:splicing factor 45